jgi:hypothetical protein
MAKLFNSFVRLNWVHIDIGLAWAAQNQYFRGSNKVGNGTIFLSFFILLTVGSNQKSGPKKFSVFSIKLFSAKSF